MDAPKFKIGQRVRFTGDNDGEAGEILSFTYSPEQGYLYQISARELDLQAKQVIDGIKHCKENELVEVPQTAQAQAPAAPTNNVNQEATEGVAA